MSIITSISKRVGQFIAVSLPSLFVLIWTLDAPLVPGADVFVLALLQVVFIAGFLGYLAWRTPDQGD